MGELSRALCCAAQSWLPGSSRSSPSRAGLMAPSCGCVLCAAEAQGIAGDTCSRFVRLSCVVRPPPHAPPCRAQADMPLPPFSWRKLCAPRAASRLRRARQRRRSAPAPVASRLTHGTRLLPAQAAASHAAVPRAPELVRAGISLHPYLRQGCAAQGSAHRRVQPPGACCHRIAASSIAKAVRLLRARRAFRTSGSSCGAACRLACLLLRTCASQLWATCVPFRACPVP